MRLCPAATIAAMFLARAAAASPPPPAPAASNANANPDPPHPEDEASAEQIAAQVGVSESAPRFSPDGKRIAFVADYDARALYLAELGSKDPPRKVAELKGRFRRPVFSPDGAHLYFTSDSDGDEAYSIFRMALATGAIEEMTPGDKRRHEFGPFFDKTGERFVFTGRAMKESGHVLFEQASTPGAAPTPLWAAPDRDFLALRPDTRQIAVTEANDARTLWVLDVGPGAAPRKIYPRDGGQPGGISVGVYSPDGGRLYVAIEGERTLLVALDPKTGRELGRYTEARSPGGSVQGLVAAGDTIAYVISLGTHQELRILDARTLKARPPVELPRGSEVPNSRFTNSTSSLALSPDGKRAALQWSWPSSPPRIFVVETATGRHAPLTEVPRPETPPVEVEVAAVKAFDGLEIPALIYRSKEPGQHPVLVSIHGGFPFAATSRYDQWIALLVSNGFTVVEPNVRGSGGLGEAYLRLDDGVLKLNAVRDHGAVARWVAEQPWADGSRLAVMGQSAGGYYALMALSHYPELWRAGIAIVPLYDLQAAVKTMDGGLRSYLENVEFVPMKETAIVAALSPSTYVDRIRAPMFVYAGGKDVRTPVEQIDALVRDVRARGGSLEYMRDDHAGHSRPDAKAAAMQQARMLRFLRASLR
jgi:dipeptidyl aminopeptidase/acylaminoacyl peptidase